MKIFKFALVTCLLLFCGSSGCNTKIGGDRTENDSNNDSSVSIVTNTDNSGNGGVGDVSCEDFKFPDGPFPGSNLWEPEGGEDGGLEISFDSRLFVGVFSSVEVFHVEETEEGVVEIVGEFLTGDVGRDPFGRQEWFGLFPGGEYDGKVVVNVEGDQFCTFTISTPDLVVD